MNRTQQLDTIEKLVGYTGLGQGKARELLDSKIFYSFYFPVSGINWKKKKYPG